jgi:hypothetical protein
VTDLLYYIPVFAFGTGLVFGYSFDTTGPVVRDRDVVRDGDVVEAPTTRRRGLFGRGTTTEPVTTNGRAADEPLTAERDAVPTSTTDRTTDRERVR